MHALCIYYQVMFILTLFPQSILPPPSPDAPLSAVDIELHFIYAVIWSCGGFLTARNRAHFDNWWRTKFKSNPSNSKPCFPSGGMLWDYYIKPGTQYFVSWSSKVPPLSPAVDKTEPPFVHTVRSVAVSHLISSLISGGCPILLNGVGASGKTSLLKRLLGEVCKAGSETNLLHVFCNQLTSAEVVWKQFQDCLEWDWGKKYKPKGFKRLICFIDDLHNTAVGYNTCECMIYCTMLHKHQENTLGTLVPRC